MKPKEWLAVKVAVERAASEAIESAFNMLDSCGTEINDLGPKRSAMITVIGYFKKEPDQAEVESVLRRSLAIYGHTSTAIKNIAVSRIGQKDWLAEWKRHWQPTEIGRFVVAPPWSDVEQYKEIIIRIEPNMAFGTGTHETTQLCLKAISEIYRPEMSLLDVGTGTGILAIAAAKIATKAKNIACDTDVDSIRCARTNAELNHVSDRIEFVHSSISDAMPIFDLVCANLTIDVIVPLLPLLIAKARSILLLSGMLTTQKAAIVAELDRYGISNVRFEIAGEWLAVVIGVKQAS